MTTTSPLVTAEQLLRMTGDGLRRELVGGELRMMSPAGFEHGGIVVELTLRLASHVKAHGLGRVVAAETGFQLSRDPDTVRAPDIGFVRQARLSGAPTKKFFAGPPDLAVEILSPGDRPMEVSEKISAWLTHGAAAVWVIDPATRTARVCRPNQTDRLLSEADELTDDDLLPGFRCRVGDLW